MSLFFYNNLFFEVLITSLLHKIPVLYPTIAPEIAIPELDGKTAKMYRYERLFLTAFIVKFRFILRYKVIK